jgi:hypothetical protein
VQSTPKVKTVQGPVTLDMGDGTQIIYLTTFTRVDRWRQTSFGRINWGFTHMSRPQVKRILK